jgi:putative ABC transport system permease protein
MNMLSLFQIAGRNLSRSRARSALTVSAVLVGVLMSLLFGGFIGGFQNAIIDETVRARMGAIQVHRRGYFDLKETQPLKLDLGQGSGLEARLRAVPGVEEVAPRLRFSGLVSNGSSATLFVGVGIDPGREARVLPLASRDLVGRPVSDERPRGAVMSAQLASALGARPGGSLIVQAATRRKRENALDVDVAGLVPAAAMLDTSRVISVPLAFAQQLLDMPGRVTEYVISVADHRQIDAVAGRLRTALGPDYEVHTWLELRPGLADILSFQRVILLVITLIFLAVAVFGVINALLMAVMERAREIGTMMALGVRRAQVAALFLIEAALQTLVGGALGAALALVVVARLAARGGLHVRAPGGSGFMTIVPAVPPSLVAIALALCALGALAGALYPALRAASLRPVEALRST